MKATGFKESNRVLGAGNNPNTDQLPIAISVHPDPVYNGTVTIFSKFKLSSEELQRIAETGELWVGVMANPGQPTQPPILPTVWDPFKDLGYQSLDLTGDEKVS